MLSKQFVCGRGKAVISILFLLSATYSFGMEADSAIGLRPERSDQSMQYCADGIPSDVREACQERPRELTAEEKQGKYRFHGHTWKQMMQSYEGAPWQVKHIVEHLNNPDRFGDDDYRAAFFVGAPGSGKTTAAKAVPHVANWFRFFMVGTEIERKYRNATSRKLLEILNGIVANAKAKVVVIIDELEELLEHFESEKYDTAATGRSLWTFLDRQAGNRNFFLIGTMNRNNKIQEQLKDRIDVDCIYFKPITDPVRKREIFRDALEETNMRLSEECTDEFLDECIKDLGNVQLRTHQNMRRLVSRLLWHNHPEEGRLIKQGDLKQAIGMTTSSRKTMEVGRKEESEEDRRHRESLEQQDRHFVQQHAIQKILAQETTTHYYYGGIGDKLRSTRQSLSTTAVYRLASIGMTRKQLKLGSKIAGEQVKAMEEAQKYLEGKAKEEKKKDETCSVM